MFGARGKAATTIAMFVVALLAVGTASDSAEQRSFMPGDTLIYDFTLEVQMHAIGADPRASITSDASGAGTETLAIDGLDQAGAAHGILSVAYQGTANGQAVNVSQSWRAALTPEGELRADGSRPSLGDDLDQALSYVNGVSRGFGGRMLLTGTTWKSPSPSSSKSESMTIVNRVTGAQKYQSFRATVVEQTTAGRFVTAISGSPATGTIATGGTVYYDAAIGLLVGCAVRGQTDIAITGADVKHISKTEIVNLQLRSLSQGSANAQSASAAPTAAPTAAPSPTPVPTPVYTRTPSPIATGR